MCRIRLHSQATTAGLFSDSLKRPFSMIKYLQHIFLTWVWPPPPPPLNNVKKKCAFRMGGLPYVCLGSSERSSCCNDALFYAKQDTTFLRFWLMLIDVDRFWLMLLDADWCWWCWLLLSGMREWYQRDYTCRSAPTPLVIFLHGSICFMRLCDFWNFVMGLTN